MTDQPDGRLDPKAVFDRARACLNTNASPEAAARTARLQTLREDLEALGLAPDRPPAITGPLVSAALTRLAAAVQGEPIPSAGLARIRGVVLAELTSYGEAMLAEFDLDYLNWSGGDAFTAEPLLVQLAEVRRILEHVLTSGDMGQVALVLAIIRKIEVHLEADRDS
jgi:hypothetical protein